MADTHKTLEAYIQKLLSIKDKLSEDDLRSIAAEMGFSEHEWNLLQEECEDHLKRGEGFAQYNNWGDSIRELNQALAINPLHEGVLNQLSVSHYQRFLSEHRPNDKTLAIQYAEKILDYDPDHQPSLQRISELKTGQVAATTPAVAASPKVFVALGIGLAVAVMGGMMALFFVSEEEQQPIEYQTQELAPLTEVSTPEAPVEVSILEHPKRKHFRLTTDLAELNPYNDSYSFKYRGLLEVKNLEVSELEVTLSVYDREGNLFIEETRDVLQSHQPAHRSGDFIPVGFDLFEKKQAPDGFSRVSLSLGAMEATPAAGAYDPSPLLAFDWDGSQPPNVDIEVRERFGKISSYSIGSAYAEYAWETHNTGNLSIKQLKVKILWFDEAGRELGSREHWMVSTSVPSLKIGETRLSGGVFSVPEKDPSKISSYRLQLLEVGI